MDFIDWKESYYYRNLIVRHQNDEKVKIVKENMMSEGELDFMQKLVKSFKSRKPNFNLEELISLAPTMINKAFETMKSILKEMLTDQYAHIELDQMYREDI